MRFSILALTLAAVASAAVLPATTTAEEITDIRLVARQNANRPVPNGACCAANTSLKQDVCNVNGQTGRCVPDNINGCGDRLTCIEDSRLQCNPNQLERGRPFCRRRQGA